MHSEDNKVDGVGIEHILYMINRSYEDGEYKDKIINKIKPYKAKKGWMIAEIILSTHEDIIKPIMNGMVERGTLEILNKDG